MIGPNFVQQGRIVRQCVVCDGLSGSVLHGLVSASFLVGLQCDRQAVEETNVTAS